MDKQIQNEKELIHLASAGGWGYFVFAFAWRVESINLKLNLKNQRGPREELSTVNNLIRIRVKAKKKEPAHLLSKTPSAPNHPARLF